MAVRLTEPLYTLIVSELPVTVSVMAQFEPGMVIVMLSLLPVICTAVWLVITIV